MKPDAPKTLGDIMTTELVTIEADETLRNAVDLLAARRISGAPVTRQGQVVGVISATDILAFSASSSRVPGEQPESSNWGVWEDPAEWEEGEEPPPVYFLELWDDVGAFVDVRMEQSSRPEWDELAEHTVAGAMTPRVYSLSRETTIEAAAAYMAGRRIHRVLVSDGENLVGLVSSTDILRAVGERAEKPAVPTPKLITPEREPAPEAG
ncbi:MAG TPA: CBS domain-containing protein [Longimicrobiaceae bacterium]|nr:CBS domain-containing protein [Longimicrobiaceae bacterium]